MEAWSVNKRSSSRRMVMLIAHILVASLCTRSFWSVRQSEAPHRVSDGLRQASRQCVLFAPRGLLFPGQNGLRALPRDPAGWMGRGRREGNLPQNDARVGRFRVVAVVSVAQVVREKAPVTTPCTQPHTHARRHTGRDARASGRDAARKSTQEARKGGQKRAPPRAPQDSNLAPRTSHLAPQTSDLRP